MRHPSELSRLIVGRELIGFRLMSDYEVTLVNDNSELIHLSLLFEVLTPA